MVEHCGDANEESRKMAANNYLNGFGCFRLYMQKFPVVTTLSANVRNNDRYWPELCANGTSLTLAPVISINLVSP